MFLPILERSSTDSRIAHTDTRKEINDQFQAVVVLASKEVPTEEKPTADL
jgi:hypothetical protein